MRLPPPWSHCVASFPLKPSKSLVIFPMLLLFVGFLLSSSFALAAVSTNPTDVVLWHSYRAGEAKALNKTVEIFNVQQQAIVLRALPIPNAAYTQKLKNAIPFGNGPDLFILPHDQLGDLIARDLITAIKGNTDRFLLKTLTPLQVNDSTWGWPLAYKSLVLFYRTDLLKSPPLTTDELIKMGRENTGNGRYGLVYQLSEPYFHAPWAHGFGGDLLDSTGTKITVNSTSFAASGDFIKALSAPDGISPSDINGALVTELFNNGKAAMTINGPWFLSEIKTGVPFAVAPLPIVSSTGKPAKPFLTVEALFATKTVSGTLSPAVLKVANFITGDKAAALRARIAGQPVANAAIYAQQEFADDAILNVFRLQLDNSVPMPTSPLMNLVWEPMAGALRQIIRGEQSSVLALTNAAQRIELLAKPLPEAAPITPYMILLGLVLLFVLLVFVVRLNNGLWGDLIASKTAYSMLFPAAVGMLLMVGVPFIMGIGVGFFAYGPGETRFVGLENFKNILFATDYGITEPMSFYFSLVVTVLWTALNVGLHVGLGLIFALTLNLPWLKGRGLVRVLLILPWAIPSYISALVFKGLFNKQLGAVNALLDVFGIAPVGWFDSFFPAFSANVITNVWLGFPFMMVMVSGALQSIPSDLYDAARVDGASAWLQFRRITWPMLKPALLPAVILGSIWTFNMFNVVFLVSEGQPEGATDILITEAYRWAFSRNGRYGYAAAYSLVIFAVLLLYGNWTRKLTNDSR